MNIQADEEPPLPTPLHARRWPKEFTPSESIEQPTVGWHVLETLKRVPGVRTPADEDRYWIGAADTRR